MRYVRVLLKPCFVKSALAFSAAAHPHEVDSPRERWSPAIATSFPQSQMQSQKILSRFLVFDLSFTKRRANRFPVRSISFMRLPSIGDVNGYLSSVRRPELGMTACEDFIEPVVCELRGAGCAIR